MALKKETMEWLKNLPLGVEARTVLDKEMETNEAVGQELQRALMARSDHSRAMNEIQQKETQLKQDADAAMAKANALLNSNVEWRKDNEQLVARAITDAQQKGAILARVQQQLTVLQQQGYPVDPTEIFGVQTQPNNPYLQSPDGGFRYGAPPESKPAPKVLTQEQVQELLSRQEQQFAFAMANFEDLADQHKRLFGTNLNRSELVKDMLEKNRPLDQVWRDKFGVDAKEKEIAEADIQKRIDTAVAESRTTLLSERAASPGFPAPSLGQDHILNILKPTGVTGSSDAVKAAVSSYNKGEFRVPEQVPSKA